MKKILTAAAVAAILASGIASAASTFDFSYTFGDSSTVTGSLLGDLNGLFINNVSNVQVSLNGTAFSGPLYASAWNTAIGNWDNTIAPVVSTNAALNNFIFADTNVPTDFGASNYLYFINDPTQGQQVFGDNLNTGDIAFDGPASATWSIAAAPVPLPASLSMLISGLGLFGVMMRRSKQELALKSGYRVD